MKFQTLSTIIISVCALAACSSTKKTVNTAPPTNASPKTTVSRNGIFEPGNDELIALQGRYTDLDMKTLQEGYAIYKRECTQCHEAKNIYNHAEAEWKGIMDDMAYKAKLNATQKNAVYKYVLAIKATQPKR